jgi:hypothetical protein
MPEHHREQFFFGEYLNLVLPGHATNARAERLGPGGRCPQGIAGEWSSKST